MAQKCGFVYLSVYSKIRLQGTHRHHENVFLITDVQYKRIVNQFHGKDWEMKISSL